jgi:hypothetical protein
MYFDTPSMSLKIFLPVCVMVFSMQACSIENLYKMKQTHNTSPYEQVDFHALVKRYMQKSQSNSIEGIYSVSGTVTKKGKGFMGSTEKEKTTDHKENYAQVAILSDPGVTGRDYIEISLENDFRPSHSIIGEFNTATGGNILLYKHYEGKGSSASYTFTTDKNSEMLEGIRVENEGNVIVTYKLTYLKIYPK